MPSGLFNGSLEEIDGLGAVQYDHMLVSGWVAHRQQRITRLTAFLDTASPQSIVYGLARPDAGKLFPDLVDAAHSRFAGLLKVPPGLPRPLALRIFAELEDGRSELVILKRFRPVLVSVWGLDLPPGSRWTFTQAAWALWRAGWGAGNAKRQLKPVLQAAWREFRASAPSHSMPRQAPPLPPAPSVRPLRVIVVTHNLNFEGAPLFLVEYARHLASQPNWSVRVVSAQEGPLRTRFTAAGLSVSLADPGPLLAAADEAGFTGALGRLAAAPEWKDADVIVANTLVAFWAVHVAHRLRKPSVFYVHESVSVRRFFGRQLAPAVISQVEQSFGLATRVAFPAAAAQLAHTAVARRANFCTLPGWVDVARIQAYAAAHSPALVRRALGLPDHAVVFANIGSLLPRKGQHVFLEAIALLQQRVPTSADLVFLLVGAKAGPDPYADILRHTVASRPLPQVQFIPQSPNPYQYFQAADICVCSSLEEVFPRVVLEAAVFGRMIVSTDVNGIPEMLSPDDAWLVAPDDPERLATAMQAAWAAQQRGDFTRARRAQSVVTNRFDASRLLPRHADLVRQVAAQPFP